MRAITDITPSTTVCALIGDPVVSQYVAARWPTFFPDPGFDWIAASACREPLRATRFGKGTLLEHLGIELMEIGEDWLKARMPVDQRTRQPAGVLHGGASVALAETLASWAATFCVDPTKFHCVGLEINANHVRAATEGFVYGIARPFHLGRTTQIWDIRITGADGKLVYLHESATQPPEVWMAEKAVSHQNDSLLARLQLSPLEPYGFQGALGDSVFGWILKPPAFDPTKRYPLVYLVHGGPQGAWEDNWQPRWNYEMFAAPGYVVAAVNFHGSTGYGQPFTDAISQHWGDYPFEDLMKGLDVVAQLPYVDSTRMGAAGASYGGYMIYWMAGHTNRFKVLVDHDGVFDPVSMYGSTEELWFPQWEFGGTPYDNRALYEKWSPLNFVTQWKTPMLIVHSQLDYRVDLSQGFQAFTALKQMGLPGKFLYFPDEGHFVLKPRNRRVWWGTVLDWLGQYLAAGIRQ